MAGHWRDMAQMLKDVEESADAAVKRALVGQVGVAATGLSQYWDKFTVGSGEAQPGVLPGLAQACEGMGDMLESMANSAETAKIQIIAQLGILAVEIATAEVEAPFTAGLSLAQIPVMVGISRTAVQQILKKLAMEAMKFAAKQAVQMAAINLLAQSIQVLEGHRKGLDLKELGDNAVGGAVAGASGNLLGKGIGAAGSKLGLGKVMGTVPGRMVTAGAAGVGADVITQAATTGTVDSHSLLGSGLSGASAAGLHAAGAAVNEHFKAPAVDVPHGGLPGAGGGDPGRGARSGARADGGPGRIGRGGATGGHRRQPQPARRVRARGRGRGRGRVRARGRGRRRDGVSCGGRPQRTGGWYARGRAGGRPAPGGRAGRRGASGAAPGGGRWGHRAVPVPSGCSAAGARHRGRRFAGAGCGPRRRGRHARARSGGSGGGRSSGPRRGFARPRRRHAHPGHGDGGADGCRLAPIGVRGDAGSARRLRPGARAGACGEPPVLAVAARGARPAGRPRRRTSPCCRQAAATTGRRCRSCTCRRRGRPVRCVRWGRVRCRCGMCRRCRSCTCRRRGRPGRCVRWGRVPCRCGTRRRCPSCT
ncbi:hypothetical protein ACFQ0M_15495 [Kitasatospora aburaviensis]